MSTFGQATIVTVGRTPKVTADGCPLMKHAGVTVDWSVVAAVSGSAVTLSDGFVVDIGDKYLRHGQVLTRITASGKYGPYDPDAVDGRQLLANGAVFIVNESTREVDRASDHPPVLYGGLVFRDRIIQSGVAAASLAAGPTLATLLAALPQLQLVTD